MPVEIGDVQPGGMQVEVEVKDKASDASFRFRVDVQTGSVIQVLQQQSDLPVPLPQQLTAAVVSALGASIEEGIIARRRDDGTYAGLLRLRKDNRVVEVECRASDAIAVAMAGGGALLAAPYLFESPG